MPTKLIEKNTTISTSHNSKKALDYLEAIDWKLWEILKHLEKVTEK
jgi:hypothetical protein